MTDDDADANHDLRARLSTLAASIERALTGDTLDRVSAKDVDRVRVITQAMQRRVDDLIARTRAEAGQLSPLLRTEDLAALVRVACGSFEPLAHRRGLRFVVDIPDVLLGNIDGDMVERIVLNLLFNAFKVTPPAGTIHCRLMSEDAGRRARFVVSDSGAGVPAERRETIFDKGSSVNGTAGLGLSVSRAFARLHGGDIVVEAASEGGARFSATVRLDGEASPVGRPGHSDAPELLATLAEAELSVPGTDGALAGVPAERRPRIVVAEDDFEIGRVLRRCLEKSFRVTVVANGKEALKEVLSEPPDLILTDIKMELMGGEELLQAVRADDELASIPVVVLTARDDHELRVHMLKAGAQDFITKPFHPAELLLRVQSHVEQKRARDILARQVSARRIDLESLARAVSEHRRQLEGAVSQLAIARDLAEAGSRVKSNFLRMMSHEIRTPLAALEIHLKILVGSRAHLADDARRNVDGIQRASARLLEIVETVVEWARIDAGRFRPAPTTFSLQALAVDVTKDFAAHAEMKGLQLVVDAPDELLPMVSDRAVTRLVMVNLVGNAVKYTPRGSVTIRLRDVAGRHVIEVEDTGPGIAPEHHQAIFEPFCQLDDVGQTHGPGSGLGLAIVRDLVEALGGKIELDSDVGAGTRVIMRLPALSDDGSTEEVALASGDEEPISVERAPTP